MLKNYLTIAWRNLFKQKLNSWLFISGLALALMCVLFIGVYVQDEQGYDQFFEGSEYVYRVNIDGKMGPEEFLGGTTPPPVGKALVDNFPEIEEFTRVYKSSPENVSYSKGEDTKVFSETNLYSVDSNFLSFFPYQILSGNVKTGLSDPYSIVLTETTAQKYFGDEEPIGKELQLDEWSKPFNVTAVLADLPSNSSLQFDLLIPNSANPVIERFEWSWVWLQMTTFVKLNPESTNPDLVSKIEEKLPSMVKLFAAGAFDRIGKPFDEFLANGGRWNLQLQPLEEVHLGSSEIFSAHISHGNPTIVKAFLFIGWLILAIACINCMNLTTANALRRSKEVGVKKVLGSSRMTLTVQFLIESSLFSFLAMVIGILLFYGFLPAFNQLTGKAFLINDFTNWNYFLTITALWVLTTLCSGLYPAFYLSSIAPMSIFRKNAQAGSLFSKQFTRNGLVVFQFAISTTLIISSLVIYKQLRYAQDLNMGFDREQVLLVSQVEKLGKSDESLLEELRGLSGIKSASLSTGVPSKYSFGDFYVPEPSDKSPDVIKDIALGSFQVDDFFIKTLGFELLYGRSFSEDFNDSTSVVLNETAVKQIGWTPDTAVGNHIVYPGNRNQRFEVIGVIRDFNNESLHSPIMPFAFFHFSSKTFYPRQLYVSLRLHEGNAANTYESVASRWNELSPEVPLQMSFLNDEIDALYREDKKAGVTFGVFTLLAVLIGCIGLFGLIAATTARRIKEIGVRKVMGATTLQLVQLLSWDFIKLVLLAILLACPVAYWAMGTWLENFAYQTEISWWIFMVAGLLSLAIAWLTVSLQAIKSALANPSDSLRSE